MRVLFAGQVAKDPCYPEANEDSIECSPENSRFALSDGASESFDSKSWARMLVRQFVLKPELNKEWLAELIAEYASQFDRETMTWSKQAAFERGSFATLLGVEVFPDQGTVDILSIGDSLAVLLEGTEFIDSYPYSRAEEFQQRPQLFCTDPIHNSFLSSSDFYSSHFKQWTLSERQSPTVLCMTDALAEWALRNAEKGEPSWEMLKSINDISQLEELVLTEREKKNMRVDDVSLVIVDFD
jgi:hypothetical protein